MKVDARISALRFVYPFLFRADEFGMRVAAIERATWTGSQQPITVWGRQQFPVDNLLAYVADFVNPRDDAPLTARFWALNPTALQSASGLGGGRDQTGVTWSLLTPKAALPYWLECVQLALFRDGVGFLTMTAFPRSDVLADWLDFLHYFRFFRGQRGVRICAERRVGIDPATGQPRQEPFFPAPAGGRARADQQRTVVDAIISGLLDTAGPPAPDPWWEDVFVPGQMLPFATLFVDDLPQEGIPVLLYRVRNFFHSRQDILPTADDLRLDHRAIWSYAEQQWFVFSLDGGAFVAANAPGSPFFRATLPSHLNTQYFLVFLLALLQRFVLMMLSQEVARRWLPHGQQASLEERATTFARIRDRLLAFTAQGYFTQAMQQEHYHHYYRQWQETFQVARLYQEVSAEVREMHSDLDLRYRQHLEFLEREQERRGRKLEQRLALISWVFGAPTLVYVFLSAIPGIGEGFGVRGIAEAGLTFGVGIVAMVIGLLAYLVVTRLPGARLTTGPDRGMAGRRAAHAGDDGERP